MYNLILVLKVGFAAFNVLKSLVLSTILENFDIFWHFSSFEVILFHELQILFHIYHIYIHNILFYVLLFVFITTFDQLLISLFYPHECRLLLNVTVAYTLNIKCFKEASDWFSNRSLRTGFNLDSFFGVFCKWISHKFWARWGALSYSYWSDSLSN